MESNLSNKAAFDSAQSKFADFLNVYVLPESDQVESSRLTAASAESSQNVPYYVQQLHQMRDSEKTTLYVEWEHLMVERLKDRGNWQAQGIFRHNHKDKRSSP